MNQLKQFARIVGKYHFWILCVLVTLLTVGAWYTATGAVQAEQDKNAATITSHEAMVTKIINEPAPPTVFFHQGIDAEIAKYKLELQKIWQQRYDAQNAVLTWPLSANGKKGVSQNLFDIVNTLRPAEQVGFDVNTAGTQAFEKLRPSLREEFVTYAKDQGLPELAEIVRAPWYPSLPSDQQRSSGNAAELANLRTPLEKKTIIVEWSSDDQSRWQSTRFDWNARLGNTIPTTLEVLYAQEDLWVLKSLANVIAKTNEGADAPYNASVKTIRYIRLGADAVGKAGSVVRLTPSTETTVTPVVPPTQPTSDVRGAPAVLKDPAEGRYVDAKMEPLTPDRLRKAADSTTLDDAPLAVAKRVPVRLHLVVDERKLNRLFAAFCNAELMAEIKQVRVNCAPAEIGSAAGGSGARSPEIRSGGSSSNTSQRVDFNVDVELYGIVYVFNPVISKVSDSAPPPATTASSAAPPPMNATATATGT